MDPRTVGLAGGIAGSIVGLMGGCIGTYFSVRNTNGPRERAFMVRMAALCWLGLTAFLLGMWFTPLGWRPLWWVPYGIVLPLLIRYGNARQNAIRQHEARERAHSVD